MDGTDRFLKHFHISKDVQGAEFKSEHLRDYDLESEEVFACFEDLTGKKSNRDLVRKNIEHYLDEGFSEEEMKEYMKGRLKDLYFRENPSKFTISNLFPLGDSKRENIVWDELSYFKSVRKKTAKRIAGAILTKCGTLVSFSEYSNHMEECFNVKGLCFFPSSLQDLKPF